MGRCKRAVICTYVMFPTTIIFSGRSRCGIFLPELYIEDSRLIFLGVSGIVCR